MCTGSSLPISEHVAWCDRILYFVKAGFQWVNKLTAFNAELVKTLFFRVVDNNRGALAVMLNEAEMQEQREALLCYFFLHFHWLGPDDNSFERRPQGKLLILPLLLRSSYKEMCSSGRRRITSVDFGLRN